ncbi:hypothetical protein NIB75_13575 [Bacteroides uniformis]|nr:hypothetical protein [Bacteroides uniformis]
MLWVDGMSKGTKHANIPDVVLRFRFTNALFKKRRNGWAFAKKQLKRSQEDQQDSGLWLWSNSLRLYDVHRAGKSCMGEKDCI